jgi:predicted dinucleotide-binding enzyme
VNRYTLGCLLSTFFLLAVNTSAGEKETIAVIGTGDLGDSFGGRLAELGYEVVYGSRNPNSDRVKAVVSRTGHGATAASQKEAAQLGDIIFLALLPSTMEGVATNLGDIGGKIVVDPSVPWSQADDGYPQVIVGASMAESIQEWNPDSKVVKAFGTMGSMMIDNPDAVGGKVSIPIASDHKDAKERIARLAQEMGLDPVDFGPLRMARYVELLGNIYMIPLLQHRSSEWEFQFQRNADWACRFNEEWADPVFDSEGLASMPNRSAQQPECQ